MRIYYFLLVFLTSVIHCEIENLNDNLSVEEITDSVLFVSLGSHCHPAHDLRAFALRRLAFPFDWIISFNGEALISILEDDFRYFLDESCFDTIGYALLNTRYELEFLHDGNFTAGVFSADLPAWKEKYARRINRFRSLKNYKGKVYFIRQNYLYSVTDPHRYFRNEQNITITEEYAWRLHAALQRYFPQLDFSLIVRNSCLDGVVFEEKKLSHTLRLLTNQGEKEYSPSFKEYLSIFAEEKLF